MPRRSKFISWITSLCTLLVSSIVPLSYIYHYIYIYNGIYGYIYIIPLSYIYLLPFPVAYSTYADVMAILIFCNTNFHCAKTLVLHWDMHEDHSLGQTAGYNWPVFTLKLFWRTSCFSYTDQSFGIVNKVLVNHISSLW